MWELLLHQYYQNSTLKLQGKITNKTSQSKHYPITPWLITQDKCTEINRQLSPLLFEKGHNYLQYYLENLTGLIAHTGLEAEDRSAAAAGAKPD